MVNLKKENTAVLSGFARWWYSIGSGMRPMSHEDREEHARRVAQEAWQHGYDTAKDKRKQAALAQGTDDE